MASCHQSRLSFEGLKLHIEYDVAPDLLVSYRHDFFVVLDVERDQDASILENTANVHFTVSVCRPTRQALLLRKAEKMIPMIPQLLIEHFGIEQLGDIIDPCILARARADGTIPEGLIPDTSTFNITLDLEDMEPPTDAPPTGSDIASAFKQNEDESLADLSELTNQSSNKSTKTTRSAATAGTTASTRVRLVDEQNHNELLQRWASKLKKCQGKLENATALSKELYSADPSKIDPQTKLDQMGKYWAIIEVQNNRIAEYTRRMNPEYVHNSYMSSIQKQDPPAPGEHPNKPIDIADSSSDDEESEEDDEQDDDDSEEEEESDEDDSVIAGFAAAKVKDEDSLSADDEASEQDQSMNSSGNEVDQMNDDHKMDESASDQDSRASNSNAASDTNNEGQHSNTADNDSVSSTELALQQSSAALALSKANTEKLKLPSTKIPSKPPETSKLPLSEPPRSGEGDY